ncbi:hypothetical protein [Halobacterium noricense]|uniref:hypothetical protein n=1 Tax=Halobacterium noricense TaxID=223182 RepID=UPI001E2F5ABC|nr:hypothetical protein [Halobacterium noricense]UHH26458.1 hypothetical protein LT974_05850 [Halobacterium noricense]
MTVWGQGGTTDFQGYDYVQTAQPAEPKEGQTWYDLDADSAMVYDGAAWKNMTVTDHGQLSGITADAHRTDSNIISVVDGVVDAETVDGQHASDLGVSTTDHTGSDSTSLGYPPQDYSTQILSGSASLLMYVRVDVSATLHGGEYGSDGAYTNASVHIDYADGSSTQVTSVGTGVNGGDTYDTNTSAITENLYTQGSWSASAKRITGVRVEASYSSNRSNSGDRPTGSDHSVNATIGVL